MVAFVFSGGGNRGALQAGAVQALLERGIRPDLVVGTSVGAVNGVATAVNPTVEGARAIITSWRHVRKANVFPGNPLTVGWRILTRRGSFHPQDSFQRFILSMLPPDVYRFADLKVPCVVTATVLGTGELHLFGTRPNELLVDALMASTAIPPFFPPYRYGDLWLVDGAVVANLPLAQAISRGARTIYVLEICDELAPVNGRSLGETLSYALSAMLSQQDELGRRITSLGNKRGITIHSIRLLAGRKLAYDDFSMCAALIESGYRATVDYLATLPSPQPSMPRRVALAVRNVLRSLGSRRITHAQPRA